MADNENKKKNLDWLKWLDAQWALEQIPVGGSEEERNDSRLNSLMTGETRPASHVLKEGTAWLTANVALPFIIGAVTKGLSSGKYLSKLKRGDRLIAEAEHAVDKKPIVTVLAKGEPKSDIPTVRYSASKRNTPLDEKHYNYINIEEDPSNKRLKDQRVFNEGYQRALKYNENLYQDSLQKLSDDKELMKEIEKLGKEKDPLKRGFKKMLSPEYQSFKNEVKRVSSTYRENRENIKEAEKVLNQDSSIHKKALKKVDKDAPATIKEQVFQNADKMKSTQDGIVAGALAKAIQAGASTASNIDAIDDTRKQINMPKGYDKRLGTTLPESLWELTGMFLGLNPDVPERWNMEQINSIIHQLNDTEDGFGKYWNMSQINDLSDAQKIKLLRNVMAGKWDNEFQRPSYEAYKIYSQLTNTKKETK